MKTKTKTSQETTVVIPDDIVTNGKLEANRAVAKQDNKLAREIRKAIKQTNRSSMTVKATLKTGTVVYNLMAEEKLPGEKRAARFTGFAEDGTYKRFAVSLVREFSVANYPVIPVGAKVSFHNGNSFEHGWVEEITLVTPTNRHKLSGAPGLGTSLFVIKCKGNGRRYHDVPRWDVFGVLANPEQAKAESANKVTTQALPVANLGL